MTAPITTPALAMRLLPRIRARHVTTAVIIAAAVAPLALTGAAGAAPSRLPDVQKTGAQMVNRFMANLTRRDVRKINALLASSFIVQRANGTWAKRADYMSHLPVVSAYVISSSYSTYAHGVLTVRWEVATHETLPGVPVGSHPAPRLSTFAWTRSGFAMTAHANFNPPA